MLYGKISDFQQTKEQLIFQKSDFDVVATKYTKRINIGGKCSAIFSDEFTIPETKTLINYVRKDAENYKKITPIQNIDSLDIKFYDFIDKKDYKDNKLIRGRKIDFNEAYWQTGINIGLISEKTNNYLRNIKLSDKMQKDIRLKSLGSLATRQARQQYKKGVLINERMFRDDEQQEEMRLNRIIYLRICERISHLMSELVFEFFDNVIYYYWDCIFIDDKIDENIIINKINALGYNAKNEDNCIFEVQNLGGYYQLVSTSQNKVDNEGKPKVVEYPIERDSKIY